jgi:hypothetical protein
MWFDCWNRIDGGWFAKGIAGVVTCKGNYEGPKGSHSLKFMQVWVKKIDRWQIVAGSISK